MVSRTDWQTQRRLQALKLYQKGWLQKDIAEAVGVTKGAISQWVKKGKDLSPEEQAEALKVKKSPGRPRALSDEVRGQLAQLLAAGAPASGFTGDVWTAGRVRLVLKRDLGVVACRATVTNTLHEMGYSPQKPQVEASQKRQAQVDGFRGGWHNLKRGH